MGDRGWGIGGVGPLNPEWGLPPSTFPSTLLVMHEVRTLSLTLILSLFHFLLPAHYPHSFQVLHEIEAKKIAPELYPYGSRGPVGAHYLAAKYNVRWSDLEDA